MPISKRIKPLLGFSRTPDTDVLLRGRRIYDCMLGNRHFLKLPLDLEEFKQQLDSFAQAIGESLYRDKRVTARKNKYREAVIRSIRILGHYVEHHCDGDLTKLISAGFEPLPTSHVPPSPLPKPRIREIRQGLEGQLLVYITPLGRRALSYELRYGSGDRLPESSKTLIVPSARAAVRVDGLTPGTIYAFEVRAFGKLGHTDWSDSATRMCI